MARIALLHYTLPPVIGGVESIVESQLQVLTELGHDVRLTAGRGGPEGVDVALIPAIDPEDECIRLALGDLGRAAPPPAHPLVVQLADSLSKALTGCDQCWVHNAVTVFLNPFLTAALRSLAARMSEIAWVAWCEDASAVTGHWAGMAAGDMKSLSRAVPSVRYVTISQARRAQLAPLLGIAESDIDLVPPALEVPRWLGLSAKMQAWARGMGLTDREPVVLVPSKLLPHKNLQMAVRLAHELRQLVSNPAILITGAISPHDSEASTCVLDELRRMIRALDVGHCVHLMADELGQDADKIVVRDLMLLSDLVFLPSAEEGFGMPILEAAALRVPIVCTDIAVFREQGGQSVRFVSLDAEPAEIAEIVVQVANEPANQHRRRVLRSWERFREQVETLAANPANHPPPP